MQCGPPLAEPAGTHRERKKHAAHEALVRAAWELFAERGYAATSVADIADRAGLAPRTFFRYFPTKGAVLCDEFDAALRVFGDVLDRPSAGEPLVARMVAAAQAMVAHLHDDPVCVRARFAMQEPATVRLLADHVRTGFAHLVHQTLEEREGASPDTGLRAAVAAGLLSAVYGAAIEHWLEEGCHGDIRSLSDHCLVLLLQLCAAQQPQRPIRDGPFATPS